MKPKLVLATIVTITVMQCQATRLWEPMPTPLPGWRSLVSDLLVEDGAFPEGWVRTREFPDTPDPTINHVYRKWWGQEWGDARTAEQAIWRAYTIEDAIEKYSELRQQSMLLPDYAPSPWEFYVEFRPPSEIDFRSQIADEFYLACGWRDVAKCYVIARYRNYVSYLSLDLEAEYEGYKTVGLTYAEIESVVQAMDARFAEAMKAFYPEDE